MITLQTGLKASDGTVYSVKAKPEGSRFAIYRDLGAGGYMFATYCTPGEIINNLSMDGDLKESALYQQHARHTSDSRLIDGVCSMYLTRMLNNQ